MAAAIRYRRFVKLGMKQHRARSVLSAGGSSKYPDARNVHVRIFGGSRLDPGDAIRQTRIREIVPADIVKRFRANAVPMASHCTRMNPASVIAEERRDALKDFGTYAPCGPL